MIRKTDYLENDDNNFTCSFHLHINNHTFTMNNKLSEIINAAEAITLQDNTLVIHNMSCR